MYKKNILVRFLSSSRVCMSMWISSTSLLYTMIWACIRVSISWSYISSFASVVFNAQNCFRKFLNLCQHLSISFTTERGVNLMIMRRTTEQQKMVPNRPSLEQKMIIPNPMKQAVEQKMAGPAGVSSKHKQKNRQSRQKLREVG